jgi:hypothetical protein
VTIGAAITARYCADPSSRRRADRHDDDRREIVTRKKVASGKVYRIHLNTLVVAGNSCASTIKGLVTELLLKA